MIGEFDGDLGLELGIEIGYRDLGFGICDLGFGIGIGD